MQYLHNAWYAAGWVVSVEQEKFSRVICGQSILFYKVSDGSWAAVANRCPHRFAPLDKGHVIGDAVRCGYHGLQFDRNGVCIHGMVWVWPGEPSAVDEALLPDYAILADPDWSHATGGYLGCKANYHLVVDNLMDLSHVAFLHPLFGDESMSSGKLSVSGRGRVVDANFWMPDTAAPPAQEPRYKQGSPIDQWLDMRWQAPSTLVLDFAATHVGKPRTDGFHGHAYHILTPETEETTHYFFGIGLPAGEGTDAVLAHPHEGQKSVFSSEDKPMLEACQEMMGSADLWALKPAILSGDAGAVRVRRILEGLIQAETGVQTVAA